MFVFQNVDGLHRKSGILADNISEMHGNTNTNVNTIKIIKSLLILIHPPRVLGDWNIIIKLLIGKLHKIHVQLHEIHVQFHRIHGKFHGINI